ncbi:helix-turn-helix domain-containing protein [Novispirillum itersonii]|uniref:helix-turn-helix domain-containing protein n=1 Tax=Novispirillum itersonii TaxID=189 RepID=UPI0003716C03|nr:helix-turn-helix transcriptional regulator [Novispirillum itersonii]
MNPDFQPNPIDSYVGDRLRCRREVLNITQQQLATAINVSFQQVQKYERGLNRMSASRLYMAACALRVPVGYFFEDMDPGVYRGQVIPAKDPMHRTENMVLVRDIDRLPTAQADAVRNLISTMAGGRA